MIPSARLGYSRWVNRILAVALCAAAAALVAAPAAADAPEQTLSVDLSGPQPKIQHLNAYRSDRPLHVVVKSPAAERVAIQGESPDGSPVDVLLTGTQGLFSGDLPLGAAGDWSLTADSTIGGSDARTERFTISAVDPPSTSAASVMIALGGASVFGGVGLLALGRRASRSTASSG